MCYFYYLPFAACIITNVIAHQGPFSPPETSVAGHVWAGDIFWTYLCLNQKCIHHCYVLKCLPLFFFFFNCTMALINRRGNLILLAFDIGIDLYSCWKYSECIFALLFTGFHRFTEYPDLEGTHITQWRDYRVQLLSKWPIWGLIPQSWCYKYHALISWAKFVGCWTQTAIAAYFGYIQAIWCSLGFCTK